MTIIEILVGLVISLLILGAVVSVMYNSRTNHEISQMKSGLQENARFAMHFISKDLRNAGYFGCSNSVAVGGSSAQIASTNGSSGATDAIAIQYAEPEDSGISTITTIPETVGNSSLTITVSVADSYCGGSNCKLSDVDAEWSNATKAVISQCGGAAIVDISNVSTTNNTFSIAADTNMGIHFDPGARISRLVTATYSIGTGSNGVASLFRNGVEMVEGVENTQFLYRTSAGNQDTMPAWTALQAVQVGVLARTVSNERLESNSSRQYGIDTDSGGHSVIGQTVAAGSIQGSRQTFASLVTRRNN